jgi:hypothetical protein
MPELIDAVKNWVNQPFKTTMSIWGWTAFVFLILAAAMLWGRVVEHIRE